MQKVKRQPVSEAALINVFIVLIASPAVVTVGACFRDEERAKAEARRCEAANSYNKSIVVVRQLGE